MKLMRDVCSQTGVSLKKITQQSPGCSELISSIRQLKPFGRGYVCVPP